MCVNEEGTVEREGCEGVEGHGEGPCKAIGLEDLIGIVEGEGSGRL